MSIRFSIFWKFFGKTELKPNKIVSIQCFSRDVKNGNLEINRGGALPLFPFFFGRELTGVTLKKMEKFGGSTGVGSSIFFGSVEKKHRHVLTGDKQGFFLQL